MLTDPSGFKETTVLDLLPRTDIEIEGKTYTCYLEENVSESDRCFAFTTQEEPEKINLFQLTDASGDKNVSKGNLERINMNDYESMYVLVKTGLSIIEELPSEILQLNVLRRHFPLNKLRYTISYQSPEVELVGVSLQDQYSKRVIGRQYR